MTNNQGFFATITLRQFLKHRSQWWDDTRHDDIINTGKLMTGMTHEISQHHGILVGSSLARSRYYPVMLHCHTMIKTKLDIGITDINGKQHRRFSYVLFFETPSTSIRRLFCLYPPSLMYL